MQQQQSEIDAKDSTSLPIDVSQHPEYVRLMSQLDKSKSDRLKRMENWRNYEHQSIKDWFAAQKKQAWDDFYVSSFFLFIYCLLLFTSALYFFSLSFVLLFRTTLHVATFFLEKNKEGPPEGTKKP